MNSSPSSSAGSALAAFSPAHSAPGHARSPARSRHGGAVPHAGLPRSAPTAARIACRLLARIQQGTLDVVWPDGSASRFGAGSEPRASIRLANWRVCARALRAGDIGFAESHLDGDWTSPDLTALISLFIVNQRQIEAVTHGSRWGAWLYRLKHALNRNSRRGSRKNIAAHYDLGNRFYGLWLDATMNYSAAWFDDEPGRTLEQAQAAKMRRALDAAGVRPGMRVLEVGCGWGAVAELAARDYGADWVGVTLSAEQLAYARQRVAQAGLASHCELRLQDYRDIDDAPFDAIVSIEMFEAVGREYWSSYFGMLKRLLKPGGRICLQTITIRDDRFDLYARSTDFIQQYIFPGGMLPCDSVFRAEAQQAGLQVADRMAFGADYARTLKLWRERFAEQAQAVRGQGFDERFMRIWPFYLAYCEAAFATGNTDVVQYTLTHA